MSDKTGWVYLLRCGWHHKIGKSKNVRQRVADMQTANPYKIELICAIWADDMAQTENFFHRYFASYRTNGEWFEFNDVSEETLIDGFDLVAGYQTSYRFMRDDWITITINRPEDEEEDEEEDEDFPPWPDTPEMRPHNYRGKDHRSKSINRVDPALFLGVWIYDQYRELGRYDDLGDEEPLENWVHLAEVTEPEGMYIPKIGERVLHQYFGEGVVMGTWLDHECNAHIAKVSFSDRERKLIIAWAKLKSIELVS